MRVLEKKIRGPKNTYYQLRQFTRRDDTQREIQTLLSWIHRKEVINSIFFYNWSIIIFVVFP